MFEKKRVHQKIHWRTKIDIYYHLSYNSRSLDQDIVDINNNISIVHVRVAKRHARHVYKYQRQHGSSSRIRDKYFYATWSLKIYFSSNVKCCKKRTTTNGVASEFFVLRAINLEDEVIKGTQEQRRVYIQSALTLSTRKFISIGHGWTGPFVGSLGWPIDYSSYCRLNK